MARSTGFFNLRRGSTKSLTFSVLRGQQITKDRVSQVANPKTTGQGIQRMRMTAAKNFWLFTKAILDHAFEGKKKGLENYNEFMKYALGEDVGPFVYKGDTSFAPGKYIMSKGTLLTIATDVSENQNSRSDLYEQMCGHTNDIVLRSTYTDNSTAVQEFLQDNPQLQEGDQITAIVVLQRANAMGSFAGYEFHYGRGFVEAGTDGSAHMPAFVEQIAASGITIEAPETGAGMYFGMDSGDHNGKVVGLACLIVSRGDAESSNKWLRSNSRAALNPDVEETTRNENRFADCLASYQGSTASMSSDLYLNGNTKVNLVSYGVMLIQGLSGDKASANGQRTIVGYDDQGNKYGVSNTAGNAVDQNGNVITYTTTEPSGTQPLQASEIQGYAGLTILPLTESEINKLLE